MATKTKTAGSAHSHPERSLEVLFSEALELVDQNQPEKAIAALEHVQAEAEGQGHVGMVRSAKNYLLALRARGERKPEAPASPALAAQVCLNRGASDAALDILNEALKANGQDARLLYLKATALAQKEDAEASAETLKQALGLNQEFLHQFRLEKDFDRVRSTAAFVSAGLD